MGPISAWIASMTLRVPGSSLRMCLAASIRASEAWRVGRPRRRPSSETRRRQRSSRGEAPLRRESTPALGAEEDQPRILIPSG
jgi:hypothetical protein